MAYPQTVQRCHEVIARLEDQIEDLKAQLEHVANRDDLPSRYPKDPNRLKYGLGEREAELFALLTMNKVTSGAWLEDQMGNRTKKYIATVIANLRKKLKPHGLSITNCHGVGYRLEGL